MKKLLPFALLAAGCAAQPVVTPQVEAAAPPAPRYGLMAMKDTRLKLREPVCSSTLSRWFPACALVDKNLHTAWAPSCEDKKPCMTWELPCRTRVEALSVKASCKATCEVDVRAKGGEWETVLCDLKPVSGQLCRFELPKRCDAEQLRLRFCGKDFKDMRVCEVEICGTDAPPPMIVVM